MKIAFWHFHTFRLRRGIETLIISLSNSLVKKGHEASIISASKFMEPLIQPAPAVKVYTYPTGRYFKYLTVLPFYGQHFLKHSYDHIVVFFADYGEGPTWKFVSHFKELPLTLYLCYPYSSVPHRYHSFRKYGWGAVAKRILADATWIADEAQGFFRRSVSVLPVGTDPDYFSPNPLTRKMLRQKFGFSDNDIVVIHVSALEDRKGTWKGIKAVQRLSQSIPRLRYFILGKGKNEPDLRRAVLDFQLEDKIYFGGETVSLADYYNMADIFMMLPDDEGNSVACHEAMSCGLPVIVSNTEGFIETVPQEAGLLINPAHENEIDQAIIRLATDADLRNRMGQAGRVYVQKNSTWDHAADRFLGYLTQKPSKNE
ncbi:MAG: glycosyltransferase family 4 protein [Candidatus Omnitrophica bacterium]|nr:glycosyltransferase family 4 protein [Candidatus Omnitrophota bacterium]